MQQFANAFRSLGQPCLARSSRDTFAYAVARTMCGCSHGACSPAVSCSQPVFSVPGSALESSPRLGPRFWPGSGFGSRSGWGAGFGMLFLSGSGTISPTSFPTESGGEWKSRSAGRLQRQSRGGLAGGPEGGPETGLYPGQPPRSRWGLSLRPVATNPGCVPGCLQKGRKRRPLRRAACMHVARQREARMATNERMMVSDRERDGGDVSGNLPGNLPQSLPESDPEGDPEGGRPGVPGGVRRGQGQGDREGRRGRGPGVDADRRPEGRGEGGPDRGSEVRSQVRFARAAQSGPGGDPWVGFGDPDSGR